MALDDFHLIVVKPSRFVENIDRDVNFSHVMKQTGGAQMRQVRPVEIFEHADIGTHLTDTQAMLMGFPMMVAQAVKPTRYVGAATYILENGSRLGMKSIHFH